jgi:hypothetical protein
VSSSSCAAVRMPRFPVYLPRPVVSPLPLVISRLTLIKLVCLWFPLVLFTVNVLVITPSSVRPCSEPKGYIAPSCFACQFHSFAYRSRTRASDEEVLDCFGFSFTCAGLRFHGFDVSEVMVQRALTNSQEVGVSLFQVVIQSPYVIAR